MCKEFKIGDKVKYRREFLQMIGAISEDLSFGRGTIIELKSYKDMNGRIATIKWDVDTIPDQVNTFNLTHASNPESM